MNTDSVDLSPSTNGAESLAEALPPLPEPAGAIAVEDGIDKRTGGIVEHYEDGFSADQMREYALAAVQAERERCAKLCDDLPLDPAGPWFNSDMCEGAEQCAIAIREG